MSSNRSRRHAARRNAVNYDADPPRCGNCVNYTKGSTGPGTGNRYSTVNTHRDPPMCGQLGLAVNPSGVCDKWESKKGEVLE